MVGCKFHFSRSITLIVYLCSTWFKLHMVQYPTLSRMARDYLAIQGSAVPSERAFSSGGLTATARRNRLSGEIFEALREHVINWERGSPNRFAEPLLRTTLHFGPKALNDQCHHASSALCVYLPCISICFVIVGTAGRYVTATCVLNWQRRLYNNATCAFSFVGVGIHPLACLTTSSALVCCRHCGLIGPSPVLPYPSPFVSFVLVTIGFPRPIVMCRV